MPLTGSNPLVFRQVASNVPVARTAASVCCPPRSGGPSTCSFAEESIGSRLTGVFNTPISSIGDSSPLTSCPVLVGAHGPCADPLPDQNTACCPLDRAVGTRRKTRFHVNLTPVYSLPIPEKKWLRVRKLGRRSPKRTQANSHAFNIPISVVWRSCSVLVGCVVPVHILSQRRILDRSHKLQLSSAVHLDPSVHPPVDSLKNQLGHISQMYLIRPFRYGGRPSEARLFPHLVRFWRGRLVLLHSQRRILVPLAVRSRSLPSTVRCNRAVHPLVQSLHTEGEARFHVKSVPHARGTYPETKMASGETQGSQVSEKAQVISHSIRPYGDSVWSWWGRMVPAQIHSQRRVLVPLTDQSRRLHLLSAVRRNQAVRPPVHSLVVGMKNQFRTHSEIFRRENRVTDCSLCQSHVSSIVMFFRLGALDFCSNTLAKKDSR